MIFSDQDLQRIAEHQAQLQSGQSLIKAAVAIIIRNGDYGTEFLLIQRAKHEADPWSGQMAFPGGKVEQSDRSSKAAAIRETQEEVSIQLTEQDFIGQLDDFYGLKAKGQHNAHVSCFVFKPKRALSPVGNYEVADLVWLPVSHLVDTNNKHEISHPMDQSVKMPAVMIDENKEQVLWGLSLRILETLFDLIDKPLTLNQED